MGRPANVIGNTTIDVYECTQYMRYKTDELSVVLHEHRVDIMLHDKGVVQGGYHALGLLRLLIWMAVFVIRRDRSDGHQGEVVCEQKLDVIVLVQLMMEALSLTMITRIYHTFVIPVSISRRMQQAASRNETKRHHNDTSCP